MDENQGGGAAAVNADPNNADPNNQNAAANLLPAQEHAAREMPQPNPLPQPHGDATPSAEFAKPRALVYMPLPADPDVTESAGITFPAYELVELPAGKAFLADRFASNPWFAASLDDVNAERKAKWQDHRGAQKGAKEAQVAADALADKAEQLSKQPSK
jgi:hypothetical protein